MSRASEAIEAYDKRCQEVGRTRFNPSKDVEVQRDPTLPKVTFFTYPDGSGIRRDFKRGFCELTEY